MTSSTTSIFFQGPCDAQDKNSNTQSLSEVVHENLSDKRATRMSSPKSPPNTTLRHYRRSLNRSFTDSFILFIFILFQQSFQRPVSRLFILVNQVLAVCRYSSDNAGLGGLTAFLVTAAPWLGFGSQRRILPST